MKKAAVLTQSLINGTGRAAAFLYSEMIRYSGSECILEEKSSDQINYISGDPCNNTL